MTQPFSSVCTSFTWKVSPLTATVRVDSCHSHFIDRVEALATGEGCGFILGTTGMGAGFLFALGAVYA